MKKVLYLMRHGETLFNVRKKIQGACDSPLTKKGIKQAQIAAKYFENIDLDFAYCSTSERSSDTLELVTKNKMPYSRLKGLKERNFGKFEGESEDLHLHNQFHTIYAEYGGETTDEVQQRMVDTCTTIMEKENHNTVLAVSHGGACMSFLRYWKQDASFDRRVPNCCIFKYEYENHEFTLVDIIEHQFD